MNTKIIYLPLYAIVLHIVTIGTVQSTAVQDRIKGSLFAGNVGDTLGYPSELLKLRKGVQCLSAQAVYDQWPQGICTLQDIKPLIYSDDTGMALVTGEALVQAKTLFSKKDDNRGMSVIADHYIQDMNNRTGWAAGYRAPGNGCLSNVKKLALMHRDTDTWWQSGLREWQQAQLKGTLVGGGCGSVMRSHPFGLMFYTNPVRASELAARHSLITHGDPSAQAACAAMAIGVAYAVQGKEIAYILDAMIETAAHYDQGTADKMIAAVQKAHINRANVAHCASRKEEILTVHEPVFKHYLGWSAHDALAATLYIATLYPDDIEKAIYLGVHTPGDSDSIASMTGALLGARVGYTALQKAYATLEQLEGFERMNKLAQELIP